MKFLCLVLLLPAVALAEDGWRDDFDSVAEWTPRPDWLGRPADRPVAESVAGVGHFRVSEAGRGMKWRRAGLDADPGLFPWLVLRYRVSGCRLDDSVDYLLWVGDSGQADGLRVLRYGAARADGEWHTVAFDLTELGAVGPITAFALGLFADAGGDAHLWVDELALADCPPPDAEGLPETGGGWQTSVDVADPAAWTVQPSWLGNYDDTSAVAATPDGIRFTVPSAGSGAKWSRSLAEPIAGAGWVALRYRAKGFRGGSDYALYIASRPGGRAPEEQYVITLGQIVPNGAWQVALGRVTVPSVQTMAVQVQAGAADAWLEIGGITFHERKPALRLEDFLVTRPGWDGATVRGQAVELPPGNQDGVGLARRLGYEGTPPVGPVTVDGVPFLLRGGNDAALMTTVTELGEIPVSLTGRGAELYLLLAARLPLSEEPSFRYPPTGLVQPERFCARIEYATGPADEQFPYAVSGGRHEISRGIATYALALDPDRELRRIVLQDGMRRAAFGLLAATIAADPGPASAATAPRPAIVVPPPRPRRTAAPAIARDGQRLVLRAGTIELALDLSHGVRVVGLANLTFEGAPLEARQGPLFRLRVGETSVDSDAFAVEDVRTTAAEARLACRHENRRVNVIAEVTADGEIGLRAECDLPDADRAATTFFFPLLPDLSLGARAEDTWLFMPRRGAVISPMPLRLREPYGGRMPFQVIGAFNPEAGAGVYLMTQDLDLLPRYYLLSKTDRWAAMGVEYPLFTGATARTVIGGHQGDWHEPFERYRRWVAEWYRPAAPRKRWFREVFNFRQQFLHFELPTPSGMFDRATRRLDLLPAVETDLAAFGGIDYLHLFDWGWDPVRGRCGDYLPWDFLGGADRFRDAVAAVKAREIPVGLYIEGYLVDPPSAIGRAKGEEWQLLDAAGRPYPYFAPSYNMCSWCPGWQEYLPAVYERARRETGAVGFYIDEYGFSQPDHACYHPGHGHPVPVWPVAGEREMTRRVRQAIGDDAVLYTEESPCDVTSQYQDGSFTYSISSVTDDVSPTHLNLYRFALPDFKTIEIIVCDQPLGANLEAVKRILFNGEAIWLEGIADRWFAPETRAYIARMHDVLRRNRSCFAGDYPTPYVPTLRAGVYANQFAERADGRGNTCWTVYNTTHRTVRGELLAVAHSAGASYRDELTGEALAARLEAGGATLSLAIGPRDVAVISRTAP